MCRQARTTAASYDSKDAEFRAIQPGDLYLELELALPPANTEKARELYQTMAREFSSFNPREQMGAQR